MTFTFGGVVALCLILLPLTYWHSKCSYWYSNPAGNQDADLISKPLILIEKYVLLKETLAVAFAILFQWEISNRSSWSNFIALKVGKNICTVFLYLFCTNNPHSMAQVSTTTKLIFTSKFLIVCWSNAYWLSSPGKKHQLQCQSDVGGWLRMITMCSDKGFITFYIIREQAWITVGKERKH